MNHTQGIRANPGLLPRVPPIAPGDLIQALARNLGTRLRGKDARPGVCVQLRDGVPVAVVPLLPGNRTGSNGMLGYAGGTAGTGFSRSGGKLDRVIYYPYSTDSAERVVQKLVGLMSFPIPEVNP